MQTKRMTGILILALMLTWPAWSGCGADSDPGVPDGGSAGEGPGVPDGGSADMPGDGGGTPDSGMPDSGMPGGDPMDPAPRMPAWAQRARIGGLYLDRYMSEEEIDALLRERQAQNVSVIELDTRLSEYLSDDEFAGEVAFIDRVAHQAHDLGMRVVAYYPSLEVITLDGEHAPSSMFKDHPDWVQRSMDGTPNVFYGSQEGWVAPGAESAWMSPNSPYRDYFLARIRALASTAIDGVWVDVPLYLETGTPWAGAEPPARAAFHAWSLDQGLGGAEGLTTPSAVDLDDPVFRAWVRWRHENIADFLDDVRQTAQEQRPDFLVVAENFPIDNMDGSLSGFDGTVRRSGESFIRVWEVDSVSNSLGMSWASVEDFTSKIAMYKWAAAAEHENLPWSFVYGNEELDASLVMAAAVATRNLPFECKTPDMTETVGHDFRARWFGFIRDHEQALFGPHRLATVGVWYSAATRDYHDLVRGNYGMYITTEPPIADPDWWALSPADSAVTKPHLGGWRGAAHALSQLWVPFKPILDPGQPAAALDGITLLWLPDVAAMSDESAAVIRDFVARGGTLLATGTMPAMLDELGNARAASALADVLDTAGARADAGGPQISAYGQGVAIHLPALEATDVFGLVGNAAEADLAMRIIEPIVRAHGADVIRLDGDPPGVHVEVSRAREDRQYLYVVNYSGLQQPLVSAPLDLGIQFRAPAGRRVLSAEIATPDQHGQRGAAVVTELEDGWFHIEARVDQFALIALVLGPA